MAVSSKTASYNAKQWYDSLERWSRVRDEEREAIHRSGDIDSITPTELVRTDAEEACRARTAPQL
jgi:hypothetical protein